MRENAKKIGQVLIPLAAMVLMLGWVLMSTSPVSAQPGMGDVETLRFRDGEHAVVSQEFIVTANITDGCDRNLIVVTGEWRPTSSVDLRRDKEQQTITPRTEAYNKGWCNKTLEWVFHGEMTVATMNMATTDKGKGPKAAQIITMIQDPGHPELQMKIIKSDDREELCESDGFLAVTPIENIGGEVAYGVEATMDPGDLAVLRAGEGARKPLGNIPVGDSHKALWTLHCARKGDTVITVAPVGINDICEDPIDHIESDTITVKQDAAKNLMVRFVDATPAANTKKGYGEIFTITARVCNNGLGAISSIEPELSVDPEDALEVLEEPTDVSFSLIRDERWNGTWGVKCLRADMGENGTDQYLNTTFMVDTSGTSNICECESADWVDRTIQQKYLILEIIDLPDGHWFRRGDEFNVTFVLTSDRSDLAGGGAQVLPCGRIVLYCGPDETWYDAHEYLDYLHNEGQTYTFPKLFHLKCIDAALDGEIRLEVETVADPWTYFNDEEAAAYRTEYPPEVTREVVNPATSKWYYSSSTCREGLASTLVTLDGTDTSHWVMIPPLKLPIGLVLTAVCQWAFSRRRKMLSHIWERHRMSPDWLRRFRNHVWGTVTAGSECVLHVARIAASTGAPKAIDYEDFAREFWREVKRYLPPRNPRGGNNEPGANSRRQAAALGQCVRALREYRGMNRTVVSKKVGLSMQSLALFERGWRSFEELPEEQIEQLAEALHVCPVFLTWLFKKASTSEIPTCMTST